MFQKKKKSYKKEDYLPLPARVFSILHLCFAFSLLLFLCSSPYTYRHYQEKKKTLLYEWLKNQPEFHLLSESEKDTLYPTPTDEHGSYLQRQPIFLLGWLLFSLILPFLLLKKVSGAREALYLLPLLALLFCLDNSSYHRAKITPEEALFPTESYLLAHYRDRPLSQDTYMQKKELEEAFTSYLDKEWNGAFCFHLERMRALNTPCQNPIVQTRKNDFTVFLFLLWNIGYALVVWKTGLESRLNDIVQLN